MIKKQTIITIKQERKLNRAVGYLKMTYDTDKVHKICVQNAHHAEYFKSLEEAESYYQCYVDFIKKSKDTIAELDK